MTWTTPLSAARRAFRPADARRGRGTHRGFDGCLGLHGEPSEDHL